LQKINDVFNRKSNPMDESVAAIYGNKVRVRACGLCWQDGRLLMVNHSGITSTDFWAPPGGGVEFGRSVEQTLQKEFMEETGLDIIPGKFLFACELIRPPLHALELFFSVDARSGRLKIGNDPELPIIRDVRFMPFAEIQHFSPEKVHGIFSRVSTAADLQNLRGFFRI
jgi:8-oxo-dGTP diphosphatase